MDRDFVVGILVIFDWFFLVFWLLLWGYYKNVIVIFFCYKGKNVVIYGRNVNFLFGFLNWEGYVYVIRFNFCKL